MTFILRISCQSDSEISLEDEGTLRDAYLNQHA